MAVIAADSEATDEGFEGSSYSLPKSRGHTCVNALLSMRTHSKPWRKTGASS